MNTKVYLAGPMSGFKDYNFQAFRAAAAELRSRGFEVVNPAEADVDAGHDPVVDGHLGYKHYMSQDLPLVLSCDGVCVLPGWRDSKGARIEVATARAMDMPVYVYPTMTLTTVDDDGVFAAGTSGPGRVRVNDGGDFSETLKIGTPALSTAVQPQATARQSKRLEVAATPAATMERSRVTNSATGGQKDASPERFTYLPFEPLMRVLRHYHAGATKYDAHNWRKGYAWSLSIDAAFRHLARFAAGEDGQTETFTHPDSGETVTWYCDHLAAVVFHMFALMLFQDAHSNLDDRFVGPGSLAAEKPVDRDLQ